MRYRNLEAAIEDYKEELIDTYNRALGNEKHTLDVEIFKSDDRIDVYILGPDEIYFIENGRKAGKFPPPNVIQDWVIGKRIETELPRAKQLSFLIGRKIAEEGTEGKHLLDGIITNLNRKYDPIFERAIKDDIEEQLEVFDDKITDLLADLI